MAAPLKQSGKKISSLFSLGASKDDSSSHSGTSSHLRKLSQDLTNGRPKSKVSLSQSMSNPNLRGQVPDPSIGLHPPMPPTIDTTPLSPLAPPPILVNYGPPRPASSQGSVSSRPVSREGSRSRPSTPTTLMAPPGRTGSPTPKTQMTPKDSKISKRHSWMPKKLGHGAEDGDHEPKAWIAGLREHIPYDVSPIFRGERVWKPRPLCCG